MAYNTDNAVVALGSKVLFAPKGSVAPADATTAWDTAWKEVGAISENGITLSAARDIDKKKVWQSRGIAKVITKGQDFSIKQEFVEWNAETFGLMYGGGVWAPITGKTGQFRFDVSSNPAGDERMFGYEWMVDTYVFRLVIPRGMVSTVGDAKLVNDDWTPVEATVEALATSGSPIAQFFTNFPGVDPA